MKYFDTKKDSLEEAISKAINEKPEQLKEEVIKEAFSKDIQDFISTGGIMSKVIKQARDVTPKELKDKKFLQKILKYWKSTSIDATTTGKKRLQALETGIKQMKEEVIAKDLLEAGGKYLKYSDLLLQKGRLMAKNQSTAMIDKEIKKEMQKLGIKEETGDKEKYEKFFKAALKKFGADSPADLDGEKKKEFFNYIDKNYKGDHEESVDLEEEDIKIIMDKDVSNRDFQKLMKKFKLKVKETGEYNQGYAEVEISGDKRDMEKMMKVTRDSLSNYKFNSRTKTYESNNLEAKTTKNVDETLDRIREANVEKGRSMREILADIWNMNEGKNVFAPEKKEKMSFEGFASDAQRKAAFASGYKEKDKKKEEVKKEGKTATGEKPTKVELDPKVK
jgi:CO dehydrogenase/acetyl-CoA synthase epsilon subunit